jgi:pSer/pThr/pTyr-binding forkhead associated (FHA) protein
MALLPGRILDNDSVFSAIAVLRYIAELQKTGSGNFTGRE